MISATLTFENAGGWPTAASVFILLTLILLWFYPPQIRDAGRIKWLLPLLRWSALSALVVMLLRPVFVQPAEKIGSRQVLAVIDTSRSMGLVDSARTPAERVSLARAFGMLPAEAAGQSTTQLLSQIRELDTLAGNVIKAQNDLEYARLIGRGVSQKQVALKERADEYAAAAQIPFAQGQFPAIEGLDAIRHAPPSDSAIAWGAIQQKLHDLEASASKSQAAVDENLYASNSEVRKLCDEVSGQSRLSLALRALNAVRGGLSTEPSDLRAVMLGNTLEPFGATLRHPSGAPPIPLMPSLTDIVAGLGTAETLASEQSARAIILLTDGHQGGRQNDIASAVRPSGVPVYPINVAASHIRDAWISNIFLTTNEVFRGQSVEGQVEVRFQGGVATPKVVSVQCRDRTLQSALHPRMGPDGRPLPGTLVGRFSIVVSPPVGVVDEIVRFTVASEVGEATSDNNAAQRWIKVYSNKVHIRLISGGPTWDIQNLQHMMQRMPWVELNAATLASLDATIKTPPAELLQDDILVLHDVPVHALDAGQWDAVSRMVADRGGSVIVIAGTGVSLGDYSAQPLAAELLPFHDLRPIWRQWQGDAGAFHFSPSPLGQANVLAVGDPAETTRRWAETQSIFRYLPLPEKNLFSGVQRWLAESDSGAAVMTERARGSGRLLFVGLDEMWRWGMQGGPPLDQRIWQQMIRYATGQRAAFSTPDVAFDVDRIAIEPGASVRVRAWMRSTPSATKTIQVEVRSVGRSPAFLSLAESGNGRFGGTLSLAETGDYTLRLRGPSRGGRGRAAESAALATLPLHVVTDDALGFVDLASDFNYLERIARASGGRASSLDQLDELPRMLREVRVEDSQLSRKPIYSSPLLMAFVLACLSAEWALRKRAGLS